MMNLCRFQVITPGKKLRYLVCYTKLKLHTVILSHHYTYKSKTCIGRSTFPAGNDCLDPYFGLSCVIGWVQPYHVEGV